MALPQYVEYAILLIEKHGNGRDFYPEVLADLLARGFIEPDPTRPPGHYRLTLEGAKAYAGVVYG